METIKHTSYAVRETVGKLCLMVLTLICLWWMAGGIISHAQGTVDRTVNIRKGAGTEFERIGSAEAGKVIDVTGKATASDGKVWYQIRMNADTLGYISSDYISNVTGTVNEVPGTITGGEAGGSTQSGTGTITDLAPVGALVTQDNARVRSVADGSGEMIGDALPITTSLTVNGETTDETGAVWYRVSVMVGDVETTGFIRGDFITLSGEALPAGTEPAEEPETPEPAETKDFDTEYLEDQETGEYTWYLLDRVAGYQYKIDDLMKAVTDNQTNYTDLQKSKSTVGAQKIAIILLVILVGILIFAIVILIFKFRDVKDEPFFHQISRPQKPVSRPKENRRPEVKQGKVMQTVGASPKAPVPSSSPKPPQKPGPRPGNGAAGRPVANGARPMRPQGSAQAPARPAGKPVAPTGQPATPGRPVTAGRPAPTQHPQPPTGGQSGGQAPGWKSRNFMADDDEFEFEFLNWDGPDKGGK
jgi:uncharacterized protein YraI